MWIMDYEELIDGIKVLERNDSKFYIIESVSEDFKTLLRTNMAEICFGISKIEITSTKFSFQNTVKEFLLRFQPLKERLNDKQKGFLGELLTHIVLRQDKNIEPLSVYFNLEDKSFKKGFDLVFQNQFTKNIVLVEVKSGSKRSNQINITDTTKDLLNTAKNDLINRLNNTKDRERLWNNALSHVQIAISDTNTEKMALKKLLNEHWENMSLKQDLFLVAGVMEPLSNQISIETVCEHHDDIRKNKDLNLLSDKISIIVIHNDIFRDLYRFFLEVKENE